MVISAEEMPVPGETGGKQALLRLVENGESYTGWYIVRGRQSGGIPASPYEVELWLQIVQLKKEVARLKRLLKQAQGKEKHAQKV